MPPPPDQSVASVRARARIGEHIAVSPSVSVRPTCHPPRDMQQHGIGGDHAATKQEVQTAVEIEP